MTISPVGTAAVDATTTVDRRSGVGEVGVARGDEQVEREQAVDAGDVRVIRRHGAAGGDPDVAHHGPGLLRQPGLVETADV